MAELSKRKLAAILMADAVGYSRLMGTDESATVAAIQASREVFRREVKSRSGRIVNAPGDSILADFASVVDALAAGVEIQRALAERNQGVPEAQAMQFRIGINLGDVVESGDDIYGDGVNIAARLESLAEPGGICISGAAYDQVAGKLPLHYEDIGAQTVKNIREPVRTYRVLSKPGAASHRVVKASRLALTRGKLIGMAAAATIIALIVAGGLFWSGAPAEDPILAMPTGPTIAVLPFDNLSGDPQQEFFSDGITEQIITELTRFPTVHVLARNSTFQYKGKAVDVRTLGRDLGARYVVEGSVRKSGSRIRVTSQLIDTDDGKHLWAETYDGDMTANDIFEVQDEISGKIVATVVGPHGVISRTRLGQRSGSRSLDSYECVLLAMAFKSDMSPDSHLRSRECLEQAVEQDPEFADAWAWLADILVDEYSVGFNPLPGDPLERAFQAAHKAIALDANNQRAHLALAGTLFYRQDPALFEKAELALALNPNDTEALARMGLYITMAGHGAERGVELLRKAMALNPAHPRFLYFPIGNYYYFKREYEEALSWGLRTEMPGFYWYHADLARVYAQLGRLEEARAHVEELNRLAPDFSKNVWREFRKWNWEESAVLHLIDGMRKAGLEIPPDD